MEPSACISVCVEEGGVVFRSLGKCKVFVGMYCLFYYLILVALGIEMM